MPTSGTGNPQAKIMIVGECWGQAEAATNSPFEGESGKLLTELLTSAGIQRGQCYLTNLVNAQPPGGQLKAWIPERKKDIGPNFTTFRGKDVHPIIVEGFHQLLREIHLLKPNVILALGANSLWSLTGALGITKWRGSQLRCQLDRWLYPAGLLAPEASPWEGKLIPTLHPAFVLRDSSQRQIVLEDLKRVAREENSPDYTNEPKWNFLVRPSFANASRTLEDLLEALDLSNTPEGEWLEFDLETRAGHIACAGISWSLEDAISIPFMCIEDNAGYWLHEEEAALVHLIYRILTHPRVLVRGQNLLYDAQYTWRWWHFVPRVAQDTMIAQHSVFCGLPKSLDFLASMYCDHYVNWKPDKIAWKVGG